MSRSALVIYFFFIHPPLGNGRIGEYSTSIIHIPSNDYPHGLMEITSSTSSSSSQNNVVYVDESYGI